MLGRRSGGPSPDSETSRRHSDGFAQPGQAGRGPGGPLGCLLDVGRRVEVGLADLEMDDALVLTLEGPGAPEPRTPIRSRDDSCAARHSMPIFQGSNDGPPCAEWERPASGPRTPAPASDLFGLTTGGTGRARPPSVPWPWSPMPATAGSGPGARRARPRHDGAARRGRLWRPSPAPAHRRRRDS